MSSFSGQSWYAQSRLEDRGPLAITGSIHGSEPAKKIKQITGGPVAELVCLALAVRCGRASGRTSNGRGGLPSFPSTYRSRKNGVNGGNRRRHE